MEVLLLFASLILFDIIAVRFGFDSRDRLRSEEDCLAAAGFRRD